MAKVGINTGTSANAGDGSTLRAGANIINNNFDELYTALGDGTTLASGIANNNVLKVDDADAADDDYAKFTATGIEGRSAAEVKTDLSLNNVENTALSTWVGTSNITTTGTLGSLNVTGNVSVGGTLTYEDVTNVDSIGIATARIGIKVLAGGINAVGVITATGGNSSNWNTAYGWGDHASGGYQSSLTFGLSNGNSLKSEEALTTNDVLLAGTSNIKGRTYAEFKSDLSLDNVENTALSTWAGTTNITTLGTVATGTWNGTAIADAYVASASTWDGKQNALTFGIANTNAVKIDDADAADDDYAKFTATGIEGRSAAEVKTDLSLDNVENTALSTWAGTTNITTIGTLGSLNVTGIITATTFSGALTGDVTGTATTATNLADGANLDFGSL